jgi:uncharacterized membrane protein YcjF (UPF0283 family)
MSKVDQIKEEVGWLKLVFGALIAIDVSLLGWLAQNYKSADDVLVLGAVVAVIVITAGVVWVNHAAFRRMKQLENF